MNRRHFLKALGAAAATVALAPLKPFIPTPLNVPPSVLGLHDFVVYHHWQVTLLVDNPRAMGIIVGIVD